MKILIADDHAILREGLKQLLTDALPGSQIGEAGDAQETLRLARQRRWDVVILDITLPGRSGLEALKELHRIQPRLPVLILSGHAESEYAVQAIRAGAAGYLTKEKAVQEVVNAVKAIQGGGKYLPPSVAAKLADALAETPSRAAHENLSDREAQVLKMIVSGKTMTEIANDLALSIKTVSTYRKRVADKTGLKTDAELTRYALAHKLVE